MLFFFAPAIFEGKSRRKERRSRRGPGANVSKVANSEQDTDRVPTKPVVPMAGTPGCEAKGSCLE